MHLVILWQVTAVRLRETLQKETGGTSEDVIASQKFVMSMPVSLPHFEIPLLSSRDDEGLDQSEVLHREGDDLLLLEVVGQLDLLDDGLLRGLLRLARQQQLVQDEVRLLEVEDDVQLAHRPEVLVQNFHESERSDSIHRLDGA